MKKLFIGVRLKRLREERQLTQQALATQIGISLSYLNQIENNQRPLTMPVLLKINQAFGIEIQPFAEEESARLVGELRAALADPASGEHISAAELKELASNMPAVGRVIVDLHKRLGRALGQTATMAAHLGDARNQAIAAAVAEPFEEVRDFFYKRHNYFDTLDRAAETFAEAHSIMPGHASAALERFLATRHGVTVIYEEPDVATTAQRVYDAQEKQLRISARLRQGQRAFQLATQLAFLEFGDMIDEEIAAARFGNAQTRALARIGLANYFAGALTLPYRQFLHAAENVRYDIDLLGQKFGVGFETTCHRLSNLQRREMPGVPFFFIRVDRAGNISKRQSATDFHFSRAGGTCPLWNVYEAFSRPGQIVTQLAEMPDGRTYLWVARTVSHAMGGYGAPGKMFSIGIGCDLRHAERLVYAKGLRLDRQEARTPIGMGCRICDRPQCPQRAFPFVAKELVVDEIRSTFAPYSSL